MFSDQELQTLKQAESAVKRAKVSQIIGLIGMALLFAVFITGKISADFFAYSLIGVVAGSIIAQNTISPSYAELLQILLSKRATSEWLHWVTDRQKLLKNDISYFILGPIGCRGIGLVVFNV